MPSVYDTTGLEVGFLDLIDGQIIARDPSGSRIGVFQTSLEAVAFIFNAHRRVGVEPEVSEEALFAAISAKMKGNKP